MCNCTDEVWIGQPRQSMNNIIDVEGGSCADDTGCSTSVLRERHIARLTYTNERAVKNGASVTDHRGMCVRGSVNFVT